MKSTNKYILTANTIKKALIILFNSFCLFGYATALPAQNCNCTISQVQKNMVASCNLTIGTVVTVNSVSTLQNAIIQANSDGGNMTILIADGTYQIASTSSYPYITASNVVFRSLSGNRDLVVLQGGGMKDVSPDTEDGFNIVGNNVTIADLTIKDVGNHGIQVSGHNLYVHNVRIQNTYQQMIKGATVASSIDSAIVQCSLLEYTAGIGPNYYIGGLDIHKGINWIVRDNVFKNIISPSGSVAEHAVHFWDNASNNIVERNQIINCDRGIGFGLGDSNPNSGNNGGIIRNNMIYNVGSGLFNDVGIGLETSPNTKVYNNTVYINYANAIEYRFTPTNGVDIKNNLTNKLIASRDGGQATLATNITNAQAGWFVNLNGGDLHLASSISSVVDQGTNLSPDVADDIDKTPRPGAGFDIGAHELIVSGIESGIISPIVKIFPNPNDGKFTIQMDNVKWLMANGNSSTIEIYNLFGEKIFVGIKLNQQIGNEVDLSKLPKGIYFVKMYDEGKIHTEKIMIQ